MPDSAALADYLAGAYVADEVYSLRPDYRVLLIAVDGLRPEDSESLLVQAERAAAEALRETPVEELPQVAAWREAYRSFGAKPQRTRNSLEALLRRTPSGLPRVNALTDLYNAVSVLHGIPLGGEDLSRYVGPPRLIRAVGDEPFETMAEGESAIEHPVPGEVVWVDDAGVTCRRWNWRQSRRTALTDETTSALFILDALEPLPDLGAATADLVGRLGADVAVATRLLSAGPA